MPTDRDPTPERVAELLEHQRECRTRLTSRTDNEFATMKRDEVIALAESWQRQRARIAELEGLARGAVVAMRRAQQHCYYAATEPARAVRAERILLNALARLRAALPDEEGGGDGAAP